MTSYLIDEKNCRFFKDKSNNKTLPLLCAGLLRRIMQHDCSKDFLKQYVF